MRQQLSGPLQLQQRLVRGARVSLHAVRPACTSHMRVLASVHPSVGGEPQRNVPRIASAVVASRLNKVRSSTPNSGVRGWHQPGKRHVRSTVYGPHPVQGRHTRIRARMYAPSVSRHCSSAQQIRPPSLRPGVPARTCARAAPTWSVWTGSP